MTAVSTVESFAESVVKTTDAHADDGHEGEPWRAIFECSLDAILILDNQRRFVDANPAACEILGADLADIRGQDIGVFVRPLPQPGLPEASVRWAKFLRDGSDSKECSIDRPDGTTRYVSFRAKANFQPGLHLCTARDITEQRAAEEARRHAEHLYCSLIETTGTGYLVANEQGQVLDANAEYVHLTGQGSLTAIQGRQPTEWVVAHDRVRFAAGMERCLEDGVLRDLEVDFVHPRGQIVPVEINTTRVRTEEGTQLLSLCRDISGRRETRQELQNAHRELEARVERRTAELARVNQQIRARARQQEAVAELGRRALAGIPIDQVMAEAVQCVITILGVEMSAILEYPGPPSDRFIRRVTSGWSEEDLTYPAPTTDPAGMAGYAFHQTEPVIFENLAEETRFQPSPRMLRMGAKAGISVQIPGEPHPFGLLSGQTTQTRQFSTDDAFFMQTIANVLAAAVERHRAEETVRSAQHGAVQANNAKIEFLSRMSHELRTPLNAILGFSQLLEIEPLDGNQRESVEQITRAGRHLLELVNEVLDISRIDSGNIALTPEPLSVDELLREVLDLIRPLADARGIHLNLEPTSCNGEACYLLADRQRVRQILINLLSNAVKYNRVAGSVTLWGGPSPDGSHIRLSVRDTGVGIKPENLSRLYTPFERLGAENTGVEGSGMGLALSKRLVESQGGVLGVESVPDQGSTFYVDLPVAAAPEPIEPELDELLHTSLFLEDPEESPTEPVAPSPPPRRTVLHIEDNEPNRLLIEMLIAQRPALHLVTASRGLEGLTLAREHHPDLILLDLHLPDTTGEKVLKELRSDPGTQDTPVVMVSADATAIRRSQAYNCGANDFLTKPFNVAQFLKMLDSYLQPAA